MNNSLNIHAYGATNIGQKRSTNQDSIFLDNKKMLYVVADGMGGHNGGDIASSMACKLIPEFMNDIKNNKENETNKLSALFSESILYANQKILEHGNQDPKLSGMGTTVVSIKVDPKSKTIYIGNVGDSRAYLMDQNSIFQLSKDHSLIQEKINLGIYNRKVALKDPHKNVLVRTVGFEEGIEVDIFKYTPLKNQLYLLCSDGLHGLLTDDDIFLYSKKYFYNKIIETKNIDSALAELTNELIKEANNRGGNDNISVIVVYNS